MKDGLIIQAVDIYTYPQSFETHSRDLTLGDLHANPIKLVHFLLRYQIIAFKNEVADPVMAYQSFVDLYEQQGLMQKRAEEGALQGDELQQKRALQLATFHQFIAQLVVLDKHTLIRLLGDELADRGNNDYFILKILGFLHEQGAQIHVLISNHNAEFIAVYEGFFKGKNATFTPLPGGMSVVFKTSLLGLIGWLDEKIVSLKEVVDLINQAYKPLLRVIDYVWDKQRLIVFSHAPIRFDSIRYLAAYLGVAYHDESIPALIATFDNINQRFGNDVIDNQVHLLCDMSAIDDATHMSLAEIQDKPVVHFIWNRWHSTLDTIAARPGQLHDHTLIYVHGHDADISAFEYVINLDTQSGKFSRETQKARIASAQAVLANTASNATQQATARETLQHFNEKVFDAAVISG